MIKFRLIFDKDKEEHWLNEMCHQGYAMKSFCLGFYTFKPCRKEEYIYRIDFITNWDAKKEEYIEFLEETGVEYICQWFFWIWLRKKAEDGPFSLYSDSESKIRHYTRIKNFFIILAVLEGICALCEFILYCSVHNFTALLVSMLALFLVIIFIRIIQKCNKKIKELK